MGTLKIMVEFNRLFNLTLIKLLDGVIVCIYSLDCGAFFFF